MKKILFLQLLGKTYGGVWQVNKTIGDYFAEKGDSVSIVSIRDNKRNITLEYNKKINIKTINTKDEWGTFSGRDILKELKKIHLVKSIEMLISRINYDLKLKKDIKKLQNYIYKLNPDYIIVTHYQILDMIPKKYLEKTVYEHHSSLQMALDNHANKKALYKYNNLVNYLWLTKSTMDNAKKINLNNNSYIYNPVRFTTSSVANVTNNKKIVVISRLSSEKRITLMIELVKKIFANKKYSDWTFEIYGEGEYEKNIQELIKNDQQIKFMGITNDPEKVFLSSSINLNTSLFEGFCMSILEALECGVPTITFNFGESVYEEINDGVTGYIVNDESSYIEKLKYLMDNPNKLQAMSVECKNNSKKFHIEQVAKDWEKLFSKIEKEIKNESKEK